MTPEIAEKTPSSEYLNDEHLKSLNWVIGPDSTQSSSEANFSLEIEPRKMTHSPHSGEQVGQVTKDLCENFESWADGSVRRPSEAQHPWKKTRMTPSGHILGTRQGAAEVPIATIPVSRHEDCKGLHYLPDLKVGDHIDGSLCCEGTSNRWGVKRFKADDHPDSDTQYGEHCNRRLRNKLNNLYLRRVLAKTSELPGSLVPASNFMQRGQHCASPPPIAYPAPAPKESYHLYGPKLCTSLRGGGGLKRPLPGTINDSVNDPKPFTKAHQSRISSTNMLKLPKDMQGRWSSERYKSAQLKLIDIMHERRAQPRRPILRPALREEARKHIGDTGLLDHLLKHMTDTVVNTGERFRRRHNAEGAMEYWLEEASLMEIRKAAGIEDPSWLPPQGWKPGDKVQGGIWGINRGMSSSEDAEMCLLKDTVDILKREMKHLFGRLKDLKQTGVPLTVDLNDADRVKQRQTAHEIPQIVPAYDEEQQEEQITTARSITLEFQLADIRKELSRMQSEVECNLKLLDYKQHSRASSGGSPQAEGFGNDMPGSLLSSGEEVLSATNISETLNPASSSRGVQNAHLQPSAREFASVNSATSSSTDAAGPITKETLCITKSPECQVKMGGGSPQEAVSAVWLNLSTIASNRGPPARNSRWDDYTNPFLRCDQPGISTSTTNSPECSPGPMQFNFSPGVARTLAKDNCPVAAAMAGMFGCVMQTKQLPIKVEPNLNLIGTAFPHPQLRHSTSNRFMEPGNYTATSTSKKPENYAFGQVHKMITPSRFDTRQAIADDPSCSGHLDPPLSLSLSLTLGSPV